MTTMTVEHLRAIALEAVNNAIPLGSRGTISEPTRRRMAATIAARLAGKLMVAKLPAEVPGILERFAALEEKVNALGQPAAPAGPRPGSGVMYGPPETVDVLRAIAEERAAQDAKWGEQNLLNGTGGDVLVTLPGGHLVTTESLARLARLECQRFAKAGSVTWLHVIREEFYESLAEDDPMMLRAELTQLAAVAVAWIECIDRRHAKLEAKHAAAVLDKSSPE